MSTKDYCDRCGVELHQTAFGDRPANQAKAHMDPRFYLPIHRLAFGPSTPSPTEFVQRLSDLCVCCCDGLVEYLKGCPLDGGE